MSSGRVASCAPAETVRARYSRHLDVLQQTRQRLQVSSWDIRLVQDRNPLCPLECLAVIVILQRRCSGEPRPGPLVTGRQLVAESRDVAIVFRLNTMTGSDAHIGAEKVVYHVVVSAAGSPQSDEDRPGRKVEYGLHDVRVGRVIQKNPAAVQAV